MSLLFAPLPTPAPVGVRAAFAAATSTTTHEVDVTDEAWARLKAVGAAIGEAFDAVVTAIKASASELIDKNDDAATDEVSSTDESSSTDEDIDAAIDDATAFRKEDENDDDDEDEDDDEVIAMLEDDGVFDACDEILPALDAVDEEVALLSDNGIWEACDELHVVTPPLSLASAKKIAYEVISGAGRLAMLITRVCASAASWLATRVSFGFGSADPCSLGGDDPMVTPKSAAMSTATATATPTDCADSDEGLMLESDDDDWPSEDEL